MMIDCRWRSKYQQLTQAKIDMQEHGIPYDAFLAYTAQFHNCRRRGVMLELSLPDWWAWWQEPHGDGTRWDGRGRFAGGLMMLRKGDKGGYSAGNVYCGTPADNMHDLAHRSPSVAQIRARKELGKRGGEILAAYHRRAVIGPDGSEYPSINDAAATVGVNRATISRWCRIPGSGWTQG